MIDPQQFDQLVIQRLPTLVRQNKQIQELVLELAKENFADRRETEDRFYQLLGELKRDREEQSRKWAEHKEEESRKWEEQNRKWEEQNRKWEEYKREWKEYLAQQDRRWEERDRELKQFMSETREEFKKVHERIDRAIERQNRNFSAIGARWGMKSEKSFRNALAGILEKNFGVKVLNVIDYDEEGTVFGRPEQVELDVIIKNGLLLICELKSSMDKGGMYLFERKVRFYEKRHQQQANRMIVISPMIEPKARETAEKLGIEVYSDSVEVEMDNFQDQS